MHKTYLKILTWLKKKLDRLYYNEYTLSRETLIREMFPGVNRIGEYESINIYFRNHSVNEVDEILKIIYSYYWGEVNTLISNGKINEINNLKGLLDFAISLKDFQELYLSEQQ